MKIKKGLSALTAAMVLTCTYLPSAAPASYSCVYAESEDMSFNVNGDVNQIKGTTDDGFTYDVWVERKLDISGSAAIRKNGTMSMKWNTRTPSGDFIFRYGYDYGSGINALEQEEISIDYDADYSSGENGNSQLGVHGSLGPRIEFYIIDNWVNWHPYNDNSITVTIDGSEYEIFSFYDSTGDLIGNPEQELRRYYSIRKQPRTSGTITVSEHIKTWAELGWSMGNLQDLSFTVEGWESEGSAEIKKLSFNAPNPAVTADTETPNTTTSDTSDDKKYVEVVNRSNFGKGELIPPYVYYSNTQNGHMYAAEGGCFSASSEAGEISAFSAGIEKPEGLYHIIGNNPASADYKFENNYKDYYQLAYKISGINDGKYSDIIIIENSRNYPMQYNLKGILSSRRVPIIFDKEPPVGTYTVNGHEYDLYKDEFENSGQIVTAYETYIAVRKDQEEGTVLEGSIDFKEHMKQIDEKLADNMDVSSIFCVLDSECAEGSIKALKNDIIFETNDYPYYITGDFNFDRVIDALDLVKAKAALLEWSDDDVPSEYMDLNQDNTFDIADVVMLKSFILGKISSFDKAADN